MLTWLYVLGILRDSPQLENGGHYEAVIAQASDYYPYGMKMKGRGVQGKYAYGYQGSRSVDEVSGEGNHYTTEFRQLDPRLGRWMAPDPVFQPWQSPYNSMDGNPVNYTDEMGLSIYTGGRGEGGKSGVEYEKTQSTRKESDSEEKDDEGYTTDGSYYKTLPNGKTYRYTPIDFESCEEKVDNQKNTSIQNQDSNVESSSSKDANPASSNDVSVSPSNNNDDEEKNNDETFVGKVKYLGTVPNLKMV